MLGLSGCRGQTSKSLYRSVTEAMNIFSGVDKFGAPLTSIQGNVQPSWIIVPVMNATLIPTAVARVKQGAGGERRRSGPKAKAKMESDGVTWRQRQRR